MNCEKCKNKKATVFYGDDGGGRHALCAACAESIGRLSESLQMQPAAKGFSPSSALFGSDAEGGGFTLFAGANDTEGRCCPVCATALSQVIGGGREGCPECYAAFEDALFAPAALELAGAACRMPQKKRKALDKERSIASLKQRIKLAIAKEDYELAATIRDEIKKLEAHT